MLQAATLLPTCPDPTKSPAPDWNANVAQYQAELEEVVSQPEVKWEELEGLRPNSQAKTWVLFQQLKNGNRRQAKLAALLTAGTSDNSLSHALYAAACTRKDEATALACLLAPQSLTRAYVPAMAYLAQSKNQPLSIRAAAAGRLLESGYLAVWPLCRSIFRSGTAGDEQAPWADWKRGVRWELPKRLLLLSTNRWLQKHGLESSKIEPNAAWEIQLEQLAAAEKLIAQSRKHMVKDFFTTTDAAKQAHPTPSLGLERKLIALAQKGDLQAEWAIQWIRPQIQSLLNRQLASPNAAARELARRIMENTPQ